MDLNNLSIFVSVVELGSLTKAAKQLGIAKSKVSRKLALLEEQQGAPLLIRTTRKLQLTDVGKILFERSQPLLDELKIVEDSIAHQQTQATGLLKIQIPIDFFPDQFIDICAEFLVSFPGITLHLDHFVGDSSTNNDVNSDIVFALHHGPLPDSDLNARPLMSLQQSLYGAAHKYHTDELLKRGLSKQNCLLLTGEDSWFFQHKNQLEAARVSGPLMVPNQKMLLDACVSGLGIAKLTDIDAESQLRKGALIKLKTEGLVEAQTLTLLFRRKYLPFRAKLFIEFFQSHIGRLSSRI